MLIITSRARRLMAADLYSNAAKARVRDSEGRLQRSHFGKQRILASGLGIRSRFSGSRNRQISSNPMMGINLAHAKRNPNFTSLLTSRQRDDHTQTPCIPDPGNEGFDCADNDSVNDDGHRRSAILRELDITQRT